MSAEGLYKARALMQLSEICAPYEWEHVEAAFDGDVEAAISLSVALNNSKRGAVAVAMWRAKVKPDAFREYFASVWEHDHRHVIAAAESRRTLGHMFRYAAFPMPAELPDVVTLWRGSSWLTIAEAKKGYSWTTDRSTACWFAVRFAQAGGRPLVLRADVAKSDIALFTNNRSESEAVLIRPPAAAVVDGNVSDWTAAYLLKEASIRQNTLTA
ncbi:hypothetical protein WIT60_07595 [Aquabacterium sp. G14]|uniref:hypothetical protein n=1 Tax=Aquabacterium sp. G14 TaxID=3130164 RepID=UPI00309745DB